MVLPLPVPPLTTKATRRWTRARRTVRTEGVEGAPGAELVQGRRDATRHTQADVGAVGGQRGQHRVQADTPGQEAVDVGAGVVEAAPRAARQPDREAAHGGVVAHRARHPHQARPPVDPDAGGAVDQDVGHGRVGEVGLERPRPEHLRRQLRPGRGQALVTEAHRVLGEHLAQPPGRRRVALTDLLPHRPRRGHEATRCATSSWSRIASAAPATTDRAELPGGVPCSRCASSAGSSGTSATSGRSSAPAVTSAS